MPIHPQVPIQSRAGLEAWLRERASDPVVFAKLQADFAGTIETLIGKRPPANLNIQMHVVQPGQTVQVQQYRGGLVDDQGNPVAPVPSKNRGSVADGTTNLSANITVLVETETTRFFVLKPPRGKPGSVS
jgi:hypothetical protein